MSRIILIRQIGYRTLMSWRGLRRAIRFLGLIFLQIWRLLAHPKQIQTKTFVEQFYLVGPRNLAPTLFVAIFVSSSITIFSGFQLSVFGATVHIATIFNIVLPRLTAPLIVGTILLFRSIHWIKIKQPHKQITPSLTTARLLAMLICAPLLYVWFLTCSLSVTLFITPSFGISFTRYFNEMYAQIDFHNILIGGIKTSLLGLVLGVVGLYYQYHASSRIVNTIANMLLFGFINLLLALALFEIITGFVTT